MTNVRSDKFTAYGLAAFGTGMLFGGGLTISEMVNPEKILAFLDVAGDWDPSLILVMAGALLVTFPGFYFVQRKGQPFFAIKFLLPTAKDIDKKLLTGAVLFGIGWGMVGLCPGPALTAIVTLEGDLVIFLLAMFAGMLAFQLIPASK